MTPRNMTRPAAGGTFPKIVRANVARALPGFVLEETTGGSGPILRFAAPAERKRPALRRTASFQKGLGSNWFRISFSASILGEGANGPAEAVVLNGAPLDALDTRWTDAADLETKLAQACERTPQAASKAWAPIDRAYGDLKRLFVPLLEHYASWFDRIGQHLPAAAWFENDEPIEHAFVQFKNDLMKRRLMPRDARIDVETPLWQFWNQDRPMRKSEYDATDYYSCSVAGCSSFIRVRRGRLVKRKVDGFKEHYALVCERHGRR